MRVECESCHEVVAASFARDGEAVRATCAVCAHAMTVALAAPDGREAGDARCPKCGAPRRGDAACAGCGLAAARMADFAEARDASVPGPVHEAWAHAAAAWEDPARHDELLRQVASRNCYAWAAGRYRARLPDAIAERQLDRLRRAAEATLLATATVRPDAEMRPYRVTRGVLAFLIAVIAAGLLYATVIREPPGARTTGNGPVFGPPGAAGATGPGHAPLVPGHPVSSSTIK
jgi:hypothetical protein